MDKELVIVVPDERAAYEVVKALRALDDQGLIELYSSTVVTKGANGAFSVHDAHQMPGLWAAIGTGALLGLLGGPLGAAAGAAAGATPIATGAAVGGTAGAAVGGSIGAAVGLGGYLAYSGFVGDFLHDVAARLQPGSSAVFASAWEGWTVPIDTAIAPYGATVYRQATDDVIAAQIKAEWQATKDDLAHLDAEMTKALGDETAKLEAKREQLRHKHAAQRAKLMGRVRKLEESWDAKIASIKAKAKATKAEAEARHEQHAAKLSHFAATQKQAFHDLFA